MEGPRKKEVRGRKHAFTHFCAYIFVSSPLVSTRGLVSSPVVSACLVSSSPLVYSPLLSSHLDLSPFPRVVSSLIVFLVSCPVSFRLLSFLHVVLFCFPFVWFLCVFCSFPRFLFFPSVSSPPCSFCLLSSHHIEFPLISCPLSVASHHSFMIILSPVLFVPCLLSSLLPPFLSISSPLIMFRLILSPHLLYFGLVSSPLLSSSLPSSHLVVLSPHISRRRPLRFLATL